MDGHGAITGRPGFGEVLRGHRHAARLTLEQLAQLSGVSARTLSDMERGRSKGPQHRTVTALADALALDGDARKELIELARDGRLVPSEPRRPSPRPPGNHAVYVSHPAAAAQLIKQAASAVG